MTKRQEQRLSALRRSLDFLRRRRLDVGPLRGLVAELQQCVTRLEALAARQGGRGGYGASLALLRRRIRRESMLGIARAARRELKKVAGAEALMRVPDARAGSAELIEAAQAMARAAGEHARALRGKIAIGAVGRLRAAVRDLLKLEREVAAKLQRVSRATLDLKSDFANGREIMVTIEGLLMPILDTQDGLAAEWASMSRVGKRIGRPRKKRPGPHGS